MPLNIDWQQILLHLLNFVILAGGLYLILYKPVKKFMDNREKHYSDMDKTSQEKLAQAENAQKEYEDKLNTVDDEIAEKRKQAAEANAAAYDSVIEKAKVDADEIINTAKENAELEHKKIVESAQKEIASLAVEATKKIIDASGKDAYDSFIEKANGESNGK